MRQEEALNRILRHVEIYGRPPTIRELGKRMGIVSTNAVSDHLRALEAKGFVAIDGQSRGVRILRLPTGEHVVGWRPSVLEAQ